MNLIRIPKGLDVARLRAILEDYESTEPCVAHIRGAIFCRHKQVVVRVLCEHIMHLPDILPITKVLLRTRAQEQLGQMYDEACLTRAVTVVRNRINSLSHYDEQKTGLLGSPKLPEPHVRSSLNSKSKLKF